MLNKQVIRKKRDRSDVVLVLLLPQGLCLYKIEMEGKVHKLNW